MFPVLTTFRKAMNSRKRMLSPTMTTRVIPVAGCCSTFTRDIDAPFLDVRRNSPSGNRCRLHFSRHGHRVQFLPEFSHYRLELFFESVPIAIGRSAHPQAESSVRVLYRDHPQAHVNDVEHKRQPDGH